MNFAVFGSFSNIGYARGLKGHRQLPYMRIRYQLIANLHITEKRSKLFLTYDRNFTAVKRLGTRAIYALPVTSDHFPVSSFTRAILVLSPIILPLQTFFSRVLPLRQQAFSSGNLPPETPTTTTTVIKTQVFMFRYERVNSTRKFTIVVEIVSLLKKICKRDAPSRAVFKVKTLAVLFPPYPREMKTDTAKFKSAAILLLVMEIATHSHAPSIARAWLKHEHSFDRCGDRNSINYRMSKSTLKTRFFSVSD